MTAPNDPVHGHSAELVRYEAHLLQERARGFWRCNRCGKVGTMAEWSASSFTCHPASYCEKRHSDGSDDA